MNFDAVIKKARRKLLYERSETAQDVAIDRGQIERLLPHRAPMLLVDRISLVDLTEQALCAHRRIASDDPIFAGHFPQHAVYPGALLVEAMGQASICLHQLLDRKRASVFPNDRPSPLRLLRVQHALFQAEILPGDEIKLLSRRLVDDSFTVVCAAQVVKANTICANAVMEVYLAE